MPANVTIFFRFALVVATLLILYLTTTPVQYEVGQEMNDKVSHALAFLCLSFLADYSFPGSHFSIRKIVPVLAYGVLIECIQYFLPYREFSFLDMVGNTVGLIIYMICIPLFQRMPLLKQRQLDNEN